MKNNTHRISMDSNPKFVLPFQMNA